MSARCGHFALLATLAATGCSTPNHEVPGAVATAGAPQAGGGGRGPGGGSAGAAAAGAGASGGAAAAPSGGGSAAGTGGRAPGVGGQVGTSGAGGGSSAGAGSSGGRSSGGRAGTNGGASSGGAPSGGAPSGGSPGGGAPSGGAPAGGAGGSATLTPLTVYLAGDSTVSSYADTSSTTDQAGWGQMLKPLLTSLVTVENRAVGGRTARRFIDDGYLATIFEQIAPGDYLLVQFGTNDGNKTATYEHDGETIPYYLDPATDFKTYLELYLDGAKERSAFPVLVTPPPRNSAYCTGGNGTGAHAEAMRELGASTGVAVLDLNERSVDYLKAICPSPTPEDFFLLRGDGTVDGTHFQENGARLLASFVASEMTRVSLPLAAYQK